MGTTQTKRLPLPPVNILKFFWFFLYFRHYNWRLTNCKPSIMSRENVRISKDGQLLLSDRNLANKVSMAIGKSKDSLEKYGSLKIEGTNVTVELVSSLKDAQLAKRNK